MRRLAGFLLATTALVPLALLPAVANPLDPNVVAGDAAVSGQGTANLTVDQSTDKAIIDWRTFDIGVGETTRFVQPSSQSVTLNRVTGGEGASQILGALKANGQVFLINPGGILFGKDATVDVGALVATTNDMLNADFMAGNYRFDAAGRSNASIVNLGTITVEDGGFAALVAPGVRNAGTIRANLGKISLASADKFTLDFYGDELIQLAVDDATAGTVIDLATGQTLQDLVSNSGLLSANGGSVELTASAARAVVNSVINNTGNIEADSVGLHNGRIVLAAATAASKPAGAPAQTVKVSGNLSAAGDDPGETGGKVQITGELIELTVATIDAFGWNGGGKVLIGGDYMGGNSDPKTVAEYDIALEADAIPTASYLFADELTSINASALQNGDGGKIILWSDVATVTAAAIQAKGGASRGDGGFIETSGRYLSVLSPADASAANGAAGWWLIDPLDVHLRRAASQNRLVTFQTIYAGITGLNGIPTGSPSVIDIADIEFSLNAGTNQRVTTRGTVGGQPGDIYVEDDIRKTAGGDVFAIIDSARNVYFTSGINLVSTSGKVFFHVYARDGKVFGSKVKVEGNGGQFLIESSEVSPSLLKIATIAANQPVSALSSDFAIAGSTPTSLIAPAVLASLATPENISASKKYGIYAVLSNNVYGNSQLHLPQGWNKAGSARNAITGFHAETYVFRDDSNKIREVVIAFEGTTKITDVQDWIFGNILTPFQAIDAENYVASVIDRFGALPNVKFTATGHSLGGALAKELALNLGIESVVFDTSPQTKVTGSVIQIEANNDILDVIRGDRATDIIISDGSGHSIYNLAATMTSLAE